MSPHKKTGWFFLVWFEFKNFGSHNICIYDCFMLVDYKGRKPNKVKLFLYLYAYTGRCGFNLYEVFHSY